jgi:hypothetical protein
MERTAREPCRTLAAITAGALILALGTPAPAAPAAPAKKPKFYFNLVEVKSVVSLDDALKASARDTLDKELQSRPEFTSDLGGAAGDDVVAELKRRKLQGFNVTLKIEDIKRELKAPRPGGRLKQLAINVKLSVFGTTIPEIKMAFGGEGEAGVEAEVQERRMDAEATSLIKDCMVHAVRQAVDQAVAKLSLPKAQPMNESKRKKKPT